MHRLLLIIFVVFLYGTAFAHERYSYNVTCHDQQTLLDFLIKDNIVFVDAVALSKALNVPCQFYNERASFRLTPEKSYRQYVFNKGRDVRFIYLPQVDTTLKMPAEPVFIDDRIFIPFDFLIRLFNTNYRFSEKGFHIGPATPAAADAIDKLLENQYLFNLYDVYNINNFHANFYMFSNSFITVIDSLMNRESKKLTYFGDYFLKDKHIATSDLVNDVIKMLIPAQSFELQKDKEKINAYTKDLMFFAEELTDGWQLKSMLEGVQKQKLKTSIEELQGVLNNHIRLHGESAPPAVTKLYQRINRLADSSLINAAVKASGVLLSYSYHQLEVLDDFTHRSTEVLEALRILTDNISSINHDLPDATYERIRREYESYRSLHDKIVDDLISTNSIDTLISTFDPSAALTSTLWHLSSEFLLSDTLEEAENYVLAAQAMALAIDIGNLAKSLRSKAFTARSIDSEKYSDLISVAYLFGKTSHLIRKMGLNCGLTLSKAAREEQLQLNKEIETLLELIDTGNKGYFPDDEFDYLKDYDDTRLVNFLRSTKPVKNPLLGKWHAEMQVLGTKAVFPVVFSQKAIKLYGANGKPKTAPVRYVGQDGEWSISEDGGKNWEKVHFKDKDNFVMFLRGLSVSCTRADYALPEDRNPLLGRWHGKVHALGTTATFPVAFTETSMRMHHPGGSSQGPVVYKQEDDILFFSIDNGKHWNSVSFKDEYNCIIIFHRFVFVCTRIK